MSELPGGGDCGLHQARGHGRQDREQVRHGLHQDPGLLHIQIGGGGLQSGEIWLALGPALSTDDVKNELLFKVLHFVLIQLNLRIKMKISIKNHMFFLKYT